MKDKIDLYFELQKAIHEHFGYREDWKTIPLEDYREFYWVLDGEGAGGEVRFADNTKDLEDTDAGNYYAAIIYTQRFLPKWVYRADDFTLICMDTQTDGNKCLGIFDNAKLVEEVEA